MSATNRHADSGLTFYVSHEAWYVPSRLDQKSEIMVSLDSRGGGTSGEFGFRWYSLSGRQVPKLEIFEDTWDAFREINARTDGRFLEELAAMDGKNPQPDAIKTWLLSLGFKDATQHQDPDLQDLEETEVARLVEQVCERFPHRVRFDVEALVRFVLEQAGKEGP